MRKDSLNPATYTISQKLLDIRWLFVLLVCLIAAIGVAVFVSHVLIEELLSTPLGIGKLAAAISEILTVTCFAIYLCTYIASFGEVRISLSVSVVKPPPPPRGAEPVSDLPEIISLPELPKLPPLADLLTDLPSPIKSPLDDGLQVMRRCFSSGDL